MHEGTLTYPRLLKRPYRRFYEVIFCRIRKFFWKTIVFLEIMPFYPEKGNVSLTGSGASPVYLKSRPVCLSWAFFKKCKENVLLVPFHGNPSGTDERERSLYF